MNKRNAKGGLIASEKLSSADVPSDGAELILLETFCLTVDGYQDGKHSIDDLLREAKGVERGGLENASLDQLRAAAFIRQRQLKWASDGDPAALPPLIRKIRDLVAEIRKRVEGRPIGTPG